MTSRSGNWVQQPQGYRSFIPAKLPPSPPVKIEGELARLLSEADQALGRLDGIATILPNPDLFVAMYVRHEAVLSSQIEGTQSTLDDVLVFEAEGSGAGLPRDIDEVVNYIAAMNFGLGRLPTLPLSLRLLRDIHAQLMRGVRGQEKQPGEFRKSQNWLGAGGSPIAHAEFVPPPPQELARVLGELEEFLHDRPCHRSFMLRCATPNSRPFTPFSTAMAAWDGYLSRCSCASVASLASPCCTCRSI